MNDISANTLSAAEDYYITLISSPEVTKSDISPMLQFTNKVPENHHEMAHLFVKECRSPNTNALTIIRFIMLPYSGNKSDTKYLGELVPSAFKELEELLDQALSDYRREHFKKISRSQRHMKEKSYAHRRV